MADETFELHPIGHVESPLTDRREAPRQADEGAPRATVVVDGRHADGLRGIGVGDELLVLTWLHLAARDVYLVHSRGDTSRPLSGVFAVRSPDRPNPVGVHLVRVVAIDGTRVTVDHLEAVDGTPVVDLKPRLGDER